MTVRVYPTPTGAATECAFGPGLPETGAKPAKMAEKQRTFRVWATAKTDCLMLARAYLHAHDGPFPLPEHLCGASRYLFRPGRPDAGRFAAADQVEPAAGGPPRPRSGPAQ